MTDTTIPLKLTLASPADQMFPSLTPAQITRAAVHGRVRPIQRGEVLIESGDQIVPFFIVTAGQIEIVQPSGIYLAAAQARGRHLAGWRGVHPSGSRTVRRSLWMACSAGATGWRRSRRHERRPV